MRRENKSLQTKGEPGRTPEKGPTVSDEHDGVISLIHDPL